MSIGSFFAKSLGKRYKISSYRISSLLDAQYNTLVYALPWKPAIIFTLSFAKDTAYPLGATKITSYVLYAYAMLTVMFVSILLGIGHYDNMDKEVFRIDE